MRLENVLDSIHSSIIHRRVLQLFTVFTRILLAVAFIPPGLVKILHKPFTVLPDSNPVGHYFNALYDTGFYYEFLGWGQVIAAVLLLFPRTAHLGAMLFLPIITNVAVLTTAVGFKGTWVLTIFMCLAATWLVAWDYDRLKPLLFRNRTEGTRPVPIQFLTIPLFFAVGGVAMALLWWMIGLGNFSNYLVVGAGLVVMGSVFGFVVAAHYRFMRVGTLETGEEGLQ
jgi:hypothetical protein